MTPSQRHPVTAVLFLSSCWLADRLIESWQQAGNKIAAIVVAAGPREKYRLRQSAALKKVGIPVHAVRRPIDWPGLVTALEARPAELVVCYGFHNLIPEAVLQRFRLGGLNFHPALLPYYRGPQPTACLVADRTFGQHGGLTLHRMSAAFDEGDVLAQSAFPTEDYRAGARLLGAVAGTMAAMIEQVIPLYCAGELAAMPQPAGEYVWARYPPRRIDVGPDWTADEVAAAGSLLNRRPGVFAPAGVTSTERIGRLLRHLGAPTGKPPVARLFELEFDCADARVVVVRGHRLGRLIERLRRRLVRSVPMLVARPIRYERRAGKAAT
jgi:methionyl-tRNA formyltransferase